MRLGILIGASMVTLLPLSANAQWSLKLTKAPESKEWEKPAVVGYQRSDGGETSYQTEGTLAYKFAARELFGPGSSNMPRVRVSWAKNTLVGNVRDSLSVGLHNLVEYVPGDNAKIFWR